MTNHQEEINKPVVMIASLGVSIDPLNGFIERISLACNNNVRIVVAVHNGVDPTNSGLIHEYYIENETVTVVRVQEHTFAYAYLKGLQTASKLGDPVIEIDSGGGHLPEEIPDFLNALEQHEIVLSTRFVPGAVNTYPISRQIASRGVTLLSNMFLNTHLSDAASGFEGFRSKVLIDLFENMPPEKWISALDGPFHMYQTEMRALITALAQYHNYTIDQIPIKYGAEKEGKSLPATYLLEALYCFYKVYGELKAFRNQLSSESAT